MTTRQIVRIDLPALIDRLHAEYIERVSAGWRWTTAGFWIDTPWRDDTYGDIHHYTTHHPAYLAAVAIAKAMR